MDVRCALVTGGARRLGRAMALHLAAAGWDIALHHLTSESEAQETAELIRGLGRTCRIYRADLRQEGDCHDLVDATFADFAAPALLVNSGSVFAHDRVATMETATWDEHMRINTLAPTLLARRFASKQPPGGSIVNILDQKISQITPDFFSYTVSKVALAAITRMLAMEYQPGIRVNAIAPGLTLRSGGQSQEAFERAHRQTPLRTGPTIEDINRALSLLVDTPSITGQIITIDGGRHMVLPEPPYDDLPMT
jgi:NAD(P)-dependent dehydrogenase (short-subunit alcohol dehydrogenase family)